MRQRVGALRLGISERQMNRLVKSYHTHAEQGLVSKYRGKIPSNKIPSDIREKALKLIYEKYYDFGLTLAHEYLTEEHELKSNVRKKKYG